MPRALATSSSSSSSLVWFLLCLTVVAATINPPNSHELQAKILSRKKRWLAFPEGSSLSASICLTIGVIGNPNVDYLSWAENWGVAYDLPNYTWAKQAAHGFKNEIKDTKPIAQRRSRRDLYEKIELAIDSMGFNGHACISRALCESSKYFDRLKPKRGNMIQELVRAIFSFPFQRVHSHEAPVIHAYDRIYRRAKRHGIDCETDYPECHFSLLDLALGKYSVAPTKHGPDIRPFMSFM